MEANDQLNVLLKYYILEDPEHRQFLELKVKSFDPKEDDLEILHKKLMRLHKLLPELRIRLFIKISTEDNGKKFSRINQETIYRYIFLR